MLSPEWMVYNILEERFIERHKVRDAANKLALSEPDFYRKQKVAITAVANTLLEMELSDSSQQTFVISLDIDFASQNLSKYNEYWEVSRITNKPHL